MTDNCNFIKKLKKRIKLKAVQKVSLIHKIIIKTFKFKKKNQAQICQVRKYLFSFKFTLIHILKKYIYLKYILQFIFPIFDFYICLGNEKLIILENVLVLNIFNSVNQLEKNS